MAKLTIRQLARYAVDQLELGSAQTAIAGCIAATLISENHGNDVEKFERAVVDELSRRGKTRVTVTSALPLERATMMKLADTLGVAKPLFEEVIDRRVVGGVRAETSNLVIDLTAHHKLMKFTQEVGGF